MKKYRKIILLTCIIIPYLSYKIAWHYIGIMAHCSSEYIQSPPNDYIWILLFLSILVGLSIAVTIISDKRYLLSWLLLFALAFLSVHQVYSLENFYSIQPELQPKISALSLENLIDIYENENKTIFIYVGRDNCSECQAFYPKLSSLTAQYQVEVKYYNTLADRETRRNEMMQILDNLNVTSVPVLIVLKDGTILTSVEGDNIEKQAEDYFQQYTKNNDSCYSSFSNERLYIIDLLLSAREAVKEY